MLYRIKYQNTSTIGWNNWGRFVSLLLLSPRKQFNICGSLWGESGEDFEIEIDSSSLFLLRCDRFRQRISVALGSFLNASYFKSVSISKALQAKQEAFLKYNKYGNPKQKTIGLKYTFVPSLDGTIPFKCQKSGVTLFQRHEYGGKARGHVKMDEHCKI